MNEPMLESVESREDFIAFVQQLAKDFDTNPDEWENLNAGAYLEAVAARMKDIDQYNRKFGHPIDATPTWQIFAEILSAGKVYE
jgi:hypothetical protein